MRTLSGTTALTGLALRRDRFKIAAHVFGLSLLQAAMLAGIGNQGRDALVEEAQLFASTPALRIFGVASGASEGAVSMIRGGFLLTVLAALLSILMVVRHTRQNEETGRAELVGAAVVGHHAILAAGLIVTVGANIALAGLLGVAGIVTGQSAEGSFTAGAAVAGVGIVFAGMAAVTAQVSSTARGANGLAASALGVAFVVSGVGNMLGGVDATGVRLESAWPAWLSPVGWAQQMRPFGGDNWLPLALSVLGFVLLIAAASVLVTRRDVGRGVLAERRGAAEASARLLSPLGLAWRLQRGALLGWAAAMAAFGLVFGAIIDEMQDIGGAGAEWYQRMGGSENILDAYRTSIIEMAGMAVAIYVVQTVLRMRAEEADGRLESLLAGSVTRPRWVLSHVLNAASGALLLLLAFAVAMAAAAGAVLGDVGGELRGLLAAALVQLPGVMVIGAVVVAIVALLPRWSAPLSWAVVMVSILLGPMFGAATLQLPEWLQNASPFTHLPKVPAAELTALPIASLVAIAAILTLIGVAAYRQRDLGLPA